MRVIITTKRCKQLSLLLGRECPCPCPEGYSPGKDCLNCPTHCACCNGPEEGLCHKCTEEKCKNRNSPYDQNSIQKEE